MGGLWKKILVMNKGDAGKKFSDPISPVSPVSPASPMSPMSLVSPISPANLS